MCTGTRSEHRDALITDSSLAAGMLQLAVDYNKQTLKGGVMALLTPPSPLMRMSRS